jgi:hypothetical protein
VNSGDQLVEDHDQYYLESKHQQVLGDHHACIELIVMWPSPRCQR